MTFLWPRLLWLLVLIPLLVAVYLVLLRRRKKNAVRYANLGAVKAAMQKGVGLRRHVPPLLFLLATAVMLLAIARPAAYVTLPADRGTVILAMDVSGSMRARDIQPNRLAASQKAARAFVSGQPADVLIGVVAFAESAYVVQAPTTNRDDVLAAIDRLRTQRATAIGNGILTSLQTIFKNNNITVGPTDANPSAPLGQDTPDTRQQEPAPVPPGSFRSAVIVLLTDGQATTGIDPIEAAMRAADLGVRIFTVGLGTTQGQILGFMGRSMRVQLDEATLKRIAEITHGRYYRADSSTNLTDIYHQLSTQLILERKKTEITALFTALGGALALLAAGLSVLWFSRLL